MAKKVNVLELAEKLGLNKEAIENHLKLDKKAAEKQVLDAAKFMGLVK